MDTCIAKRDYSLRPYHLLLVYTCSSLMSVVPTLLCSWIYFVVVMSWSCSQADKACSARESESCSQLCRKQSVQLSDVRKSYWLKKESWWRNHATNNNIAGTNGIVCANITSFVMNKKTTEGSTLALRVHRAAASDKR